MIGALKGAAKRAGRLCFGNYQLNRIYYRDLNESSAGFSVPATTGQKNGDIRIERVLAVEQVAEARDSEITAHAWYGDAASIGYGLWERGELVSLVWFWTIENDELPGRFAHLSDKEAVMVDLVTASRCRGKGYAVALSQFAAKDLKLRGFSRLWTWVWHSNTASIKVFSKLNWTYSYFLVEVKPWPAREYFRIRMPFGEGSAGRKAMLSVRDKGGAGS